ncbi:putative leucine-rich repeat-containing protein DDB_G0290503 [Polyergus mexicanus]|uniref:putative leucine-rich repeat-containing protein DDB_G0290503 n=1 Tax=Polyergus mexicanus TaxID=615972 RepID=UPI0038B5CF8E
MPRSTPKSKRSESRRSSILKPRKPRQPLQNVNFDSPYNEKSLTPSKTKRRVSFADKKHVKEFCHSVEQGTVWDNTYEEHDSKHDSSLKGSFVSLDSNAKTESKENAFLCISNNECVHILESNSSYSNNFNLTNNQLSESNIKVKEKDNENCDLDFTNPIEMKLFDEEFQFQETILPNKSGISQPSKDVTLSGIIACSNTDEKYVEPPDEISQHEQNVMPNALSVSNVSKNAISSNIIIYRDSDEEKNANNTGIKSYSELCCSNVDSELDVTCAQDSSMEFTTPMHMPLLSLHTEEEINVQKDECSLNLNLNTDWVSNCNNVSIQAVPISMKPVNSDLGIFEQISKIQTHGRTNSTAGKNTHNKTISSTNLQSNIASENIVFKHTQDATQNINESMMLTNVIQPSTTSIDISHINNPIQTHESTNSTTGNNTHNKMMFSTNLQSNIVSENTVFKHTQDATQNVSESMMLTNVIQPSTTDISHINNTAFNVSMEMTTAISSKMYDRSIAHPHVENIIKDNNLRENQTDETEFFNDVMEITKPVNTLPLIAYDKENLKIDELISKNDRTMFFHNVSMEMTKVLKNQEEITRPIIHKSISEENTCKEKNMDNGFDEKTRLLYKSMEITEAVPVSLHNEKPLNIICAAQSTSFSQTMSKACLPVENSMKSFQADTAANKTIQHVSMEVTDTVLSTLQLTRDATNERENLNISRDNEFQHLTTDNLTKLKKSAAKEHYIISREIAEMTDTRDKLPNNFVIPSLLNNLDHSLNAVLRNISSTNETIFDENEQSNSKKICKSFIESHTPQENNVCLSPRPSDIYINDTGHNEYFVKDTMDHTGLSTSNFRDDLNEISECSLLKTLGNSIEELQSIKPPSFILLDSDKEDNSFSDALCKDKLQISTGDGTIDNIHNSSNQLVINYVPEYECLAESRKSITKDNESFTVLRENESINIENIQMEDCSRRTIANKSEQEDDCEAIRRIIINDSRINESNHCSTNVENFYAENVLSIQNNKHEETNTDHCKSPIIKENEIIAKVEYIQERVNNDSNPQNNVKEKEEYSNVQRLKTEQCTDHIKRLEAIENQLNSENNCKENLNDKIRVIEMEQNEECIEERLAVERCVSASQDESLVEQDPFLSLSQKLETHCERDDCIWNMYHKNIDKKMIVFGFISNSLLIAMHLSYDLNYSEENLINKIKIISRVSDDSGVLVRIVHKLILEKLDAKLLMYRYTTHEDILPMLECVSEHVKLAMNFMFDLKHLDNLNLMEITYDHISFLSRSKQMDTILKVTVKVKRFDELTSKDVKVHCLLGTIRETDVKSLIKNIKKDHKFLRKYINDVKDYIDIMEETSIAKKV